MPIPIGRLNPRVLLAVRAAPPGPVPHPPGLPDPFSRVDLRRPPSTAISSYGHEFINLSSQLLTLVRYHRRIIDIKHMRTRAPYEDRLLFSLGS